MRIFLLLLFSAVFVVMLAMTIRASMENSVLNVPGEVLADRWFQATLTDAYLGFITFYAWVAYRETSWFSRIIWFLLIMSLGNMAMSAYVIFRLLRLPSQATLEDLLLRPRPGRPDKRLPSAQAN